MDISIIVPIYNAENYLMECVESILSQKFTGDFELILINDGSSDSTDSIVRNLLKKHKNINYIKQENRGVSAARNEGIKSANGKYLMFVDSDDKLMNDVVLENMYQLVVENDLDFAIADFVYDYKGLQSNVYHSIRNVNGIEDNIFRGQDFYEQTIDKGLTAMVWNKIIKKKFIEDNNLYFEENYIYEDVLYNTLLFYYAEKVSYVSLPIYLYNQENESIMRGNKPKNYDSLFYMAKKFSDLYLKTSWSAFLDQEVHMYKEITIDLLKNKNTFDKYPKYIRRVLNKDIRKKYQQHSNKKYKLFYILTSLLSVFVKEGN